MFPLAGSSLDNQIPAPDDLYTGQVHTQPLNVAAGTYARGDVLGMDSTTDTLGALSEPADAFAVMPFDVTLNAGQMLSVYVGGDFNEDALGLNGADLAPTKTALAGRGIRARKWGVAPDSQ